MSGLKAQFLASLSHEIRTPLSGILGMLDLLLETELSEEQKEYAQSSHVCAENLLEIMNVTLEYSALSANQIELEDAEFSLTELMRTLFSEFSAKAMEKNLFLISSHEPNLPELVIGDEFRLKQLLCHIIGNALKFTQMGQVEISASARLRHEREALVTFSVRDTGIGIPAEKLESIFDFRQLESGLARRFSGMGLGLAVTQKLADLMGAEIKVSSEVGRGSTFRVMVPLRLPVEMPKLASIHVRDNPSLESFA